MDDESGVRRKRSAQLTCVPPETALVAHGSGTSTVARSAIGFDLVEKNE